MKIHCSQKLKQIIKVIPVLLLLSCMSAVLAASVFRSDSKTGVSGTNIAPQYASSNKAGGLVVFGSEGVTWNQTQRIPVFETLKSGREKLIAPGVSGTYRFNVMNTSGYDMEYSLDMTEENVHNLPMEFRLLVEGAYLAGDEATWVKMNEIKPYLAVLKDTQETRITLDWRWAPQSDGKDTALGFAANEIDLFYKLSFSVVAQVDDQIPGGENGKPPAGSGIATGDRPLFVIVVTALSAAGLALLGYSRKRVELGSR